MDSTERTVIRLFAKNEHGRLEILKEFSRALTNAAKRRDLVVSVNFEELAPRNCVEVQVEFPVNLTPEARQEVFAEATETVNEEIKKVKIIGISRQELARIKEFLE